ncbi:MAG: bifunctional 3,4-dihydroxy-2-butanone-4-phosphate synthase/GTP cyclohydrolase II [Elusimicrobiales bacterium]|nr:bifunctional 3,4-dihydroxy-2-butanone-4-phosphate synthase/GTP cyclohydrolase II [Elusimicrobiales bacterium]
MKELLNSIDEIVTELKKGRMVIVIDDEERENEGDIVIAAEYATQKNINFIIKYARGLICVPVTNEIAKRLDLYPMDKVNTDPYKTNWLISVDAKNGITTGISAEDRAKTIRLLSNPNSKPQDFSKPGHIFPLLAKDGGVLERAGHTEAAIDLMKIAGLNPVAVICEIMTDNGKMARLNDLIRFAGKHKIKITSIEKLIEYRRKTETLIEEISKANLPTIFGNFEIRIFREKLTGKEHVALIKGKISENNPVIVRVHSECLTGDVFSSLRCDCGSQLITAMKIISKSNSGVFLYMRQEGRGIGLGNKILAYHLQEKGYDTVEANIKLGFKPDLRDYGIGAQILRKLGVRKMKLLTNNPKKIVGLKGYGLKIVERIPIVVSPNPHNEKYLKAKRKKLGHLI